MLKRLIADLAGKKALWQRDLSSVKEVVAAKSSAPAGSMKPAIELPTAPVGPPEEWVRSDWGLRNVTLLLPSVSTRASYLKFSLEHLRGCKVHVPILLSDHSEPEQRGVIEQLVGQFPELDVRILHHTRSLHFLERLNECAGAAETDYVVVHADDDFMLPDALSQCVQFLELHPDHVACQGRTFFLSVELPNIGRPSPHRSMSRQESTVEDRIGNHCRNFTATLYAVTRRDAFIRANESALSHTDNVIFWQYLSSCLLLAAGKLRTLDVLYYLRLNNPKGWRASLVRNADPTHWPYLVVAPHFSKELERFKSGLSAALAAMPSMEREALIDDCCLGLVRRAFSGTQAIEAAEVEMAKQLQSPMTIEHAIVRYCGSLSLAALTDGATSV
jgi:glycosyltransferase domain-containing protein